MDVETQILEAVRRETNLAADQVTLASTFAELGLDSLQITQMVMELEDALSVQLKDEDVVAILEANRLSDVSRVISQRAAAPAEA